MLHAAFERNGGKLFSDQVYYYNHAKVAVRGHEVAQLATRLEHWS